MNIKYILFDEINSTSKWAEDHIDEFRRKCINNN